MIYHARTDPLLDGRRPVGLEPSAPILTLAAAESFLSRSRNFTPSATPRNATAPTPIHQPLKDTTFWGASPEGAKSASP
jgi:hypothetical protein